MREPSQCAMRRRTSSGTGREWRREEKKGMAVGGVGGAWWVRLMREKGASVGRRRRGGERRRESEAETEMGATEIGPIVRPISPKNAIGHSPDPACQIGRLSTSLSFRGRTLKEMHMETVIHQPPRQSTIQQTRCDPISAALPSSAMSRSTSSAIALSARTILTQRPVRMFRTSLSCATTLTSAVADTSQLVLLEQ